MVQLSAGRPFLLESASARLAIGRSLPSLPQWPLQQKDCHKGPASRCPMPFPSLPSQETNLGSPLNTGYSQMYLPHYPFLKVTSL